MDTIHNFLEESAKKFPSRAALIANGRSFSYREVNSAAEKIASFVASKSAFQDRIAICLPNSFALVASYFGVLKAGRAALLTDPAIAPDAWKARASLAEPALVISGAGVPAAIKKSARGIKIYDADVLTRQPPVKRKPQRVLPHHVASLLFTTGTTGSPKGVVVRHVNAVAAADNILKVLKYAPGAVDVNPLPLTHSFGLGNMHAVCAAGGTVLLHKNFINLKKILEDIREYRAESFSATPPIFETLAGPMSAEFRRNCRYLKMILTNSAPVPPATIKKILALAPRADFFTYYGLTEASRSTFINYRTERKFTSVGKPAPGIAIAVVSPAGRKMTPRRIGEVRIKGPTVVSGYYKNLGATRERIKNKWLATGDYGYCDEEGYLYLTGRTDEVMNIGGNKVYPHEIEEVLKKHARVADAAVVAMRDPWLGSVPRAVVVVKGAYDEDALREKLKKLCRARLEPFKVPKIIEFSAGLPRTASGKLQKRLL